MSASEDFLELRRHRAVKLMQLGESKEVISRILGVSKVTLGVWLRKANAGESLKAKQREGRPRRLEEWQLAKLEKLLKQGATAHGWENNLWTSSRIREVIREHLGVEFCRSHVWYIVTNYLGWSSRRPVQQASKRDDVEIDRWKANEFPRIERQARERNAYLAFIDQSGFMMSPTVRRTFAPRGSTPVNKVFNPHGRISVCGAITVSPKRSCIGLHYLMLNDDTNFRGPSVVEFVKHLRNQISGPITVIWDQIPIHSSDVVLEYLQTVPDIIIEPFPPYAPELNPVDKLWFYLKYGRLPNFTPPTMAKLRCSVESELKRLQGRPDLLRSFIRQSGVPLLL